MVGDRVKTLGLGKLSLVSLSLLYLQGFAIMQFVLQANSVVYFEPSFRWNLFTEVITT